VKPKDWPSVTGGLGFSDNHVDLREGFAVRLHRGSIFSTTPWVMLSKVGRPQTPFDLDSAELAVLKRERQGAEEFLRHELFDVCEQLAHRCRIWDRIRLNKMVRCAKTWETHATF